MSTDDHRHALNAPNWQSAFDHLLVSTKHQPSLCSHITRLPPDMCLSFIINCPAYSSNFFLTSIIPLTQSRITTIKRKLLSCVVPHTPMPTLTCMCNVYVFLLAINQNLPYYDAALNLFINIAQDYRIYVYILEMWIYPILSEPK